MRYSYSSISTYGKCPRKFKHAYIDRLPKSTEVSPAMERGLQIHQAAEKMILGEFVPEIPRPLLYYQEFLTQLRDMKALPEHKFALNHEWGLTDWDAPDAQIAGVIDAHLFSEELTVWEFKTGRIYAEHIDQRELYGLAGLVLYPESPSVHVENVYFDLQDSEANTWHREEMDTLKEKWQRKIDRIEADEAFVPNPHWGCRYCDFSKEKGGPCPF